MRIILVLVSLFLLAGCETYGASSTVPVNKSVNFTLGFQSGSYYRYRVHPYYRHYHHHYHHHQYRQHRNHQKFNHKFRNHKRRIRRHH